MKRLLILAVVALAGCQATAKPDPKICAAITDPAEAVSIEDGSAKQQDANWTRVYAEACVHRSAYNFSQGPDSADAISRAVLESCEGKIERAAFNLGEEAAARFATSDQATQRAVAKETRDDALESYDRLALLRVVEARAGHCKAD